MTQHQAPKPSYRSGPPDLSMITIEERGLSLPSLRPFDMGRERLKMHHAELERERCHIYAGNLYCFCGECSP